MCYGLLGFNGMDCRRRSQGSTSASNASRSSMTSTSGPGGSTAVNALGEDCDLTRPFLVRMTDLSVDKPAG